MSNNWGTDPAWVVSSFALAVGEDNFVAAFNLGPSGLQSAPAYANWGVRNRYDSLGGRA